MSKLGFKDWWAVQDSNLRPPVCKTDALPAELTALIFNGLNFKGNPGLSQRNYSKYACFSSIGKLTVFVY